MSATTRGEQEEPAEPRPPSAAPARTAVPLLFRQSDSFVALLQELGASLLVTTYQAQQLLDPANQQAAVEAATQATWWTLLGTLLSMAAAVVGALMGAGPTFRLRAIGVPTHRAEYEERRIPDRT